MNIHERMESLTDLYGAGGLSPDERGEVDLHVAACADCAARLGDARAFAAWARGSIEPDRPPADLEERLVGRFRAAATRGSRRWGVVWRALRVASALASTAALIILGNLFTGGSAISFPHGMALAEADFRADDREWSEHGRLLDESPANATAMLGRGSVIAPLRLQEAQKYSARSRSLSTTGLAGKSVDLPGGAPPAPPASPASSASDPALVAQLADLREQGGNRAKNGAYSYDGSIEAKLKKDAVSPEAPPQDTRKIIRTGELTLEVDGYEAAYAKLTPIVAADRGQISNASVQKLPNGKIRATLTVRVPPERFEALLAACAGLGTVRHQEIGSQDVTKAYVDLESRLKSKETLAERLRKLLAEGKGTVKELMEVEVQMGATVEAIEQIKGEIRYYDNQVGLSTLTLHISEKDLGQPFEYVQTLQAVLALTVRDPDDIYAKAQKEITQAGGQVVDSRMSRQNDGSSTGTIRGRVAAEKFPALREALKALGTVTQDTVNQQKTARGGQEGSPAADAPLRKELAVVDLTISSPQLFVTRRSTLLVETEAVESAYQNARRAIEGAGGKIIDGSLSGSAAGASATLKAQVDSEKFSSLVESLKTAGKVKNAAVNQVLPSASPDGAPPLLRERAEIELSLVSPPALIGEDQGILKSVRGTLASSWGAILWSVEKLFVGLSLAGPWIALLVAALYVARRLRRKKAAQS